MLRTFDSIRFLREESVYTKLKNTLLKTFLSKTDFIQTFCKIH